MKRILLLLPIILLVSTASPAQKTIEFRINGVSSNIGDMDGFGAGASDPEWYYRINDNTFGITQNSAYQIPGLNCPGIRTHLNTFFSQQYDCELPTSFNFTFRGFEDDGASVDADSGFRNFTISTGLLNTTGTGIWQNVFTGSGWVEVRAVGTDCVASLNSPASTQGSGSVRYQIRLQYRVVGTTLCNDECSDPYILPTAADYSCGGSQVFTPLNINISAMEPADASQFSHTMSGINCVYEGSSSEDIWLQTTIPDSAGGVIIQFENLGGCNGAMCQTNISYAWYTSSNGSCSGLEYRGCGTTNCFIGCTDGQMQVDGTPGEDVWVRVWEEDDEGFNIRINGIEPIGPSDKCYTALSLNGQGCNYGATSPTSGSYAEPDLASWTAAAHPGGVCQDGDSDPMTNTLWSSNENLVWYTYTHAGGDFNLAIDNMNCTGGAATAQLGVFSNSGTPSSPSCDLASETGYGCSVGVGAVQLSISSLPAGEYIIVVDGNAGAECSWIFTDFVGNTPLPVELGSFNAELIDQSNVELTWVTITEVNNDYFVVQRSNDGQDWEDVEFVSGAGNSQNTARYVSNDYSPIKGVSYYRIKQVDFDGEYSTSIVKQVNNNIWSDILLYPNPVNSSLTIEYNEELETEMKITDHIGQAVYCPVLKLTDKMQYNTSSLPSGVYFVQIFRDGFNQVMKFVVSH